MLLDMARERIKGRLDAEGMLQKDIRIRAKVLSAQEAIGNPERRDFPLLKGRERIVEADYEGSLGHAAGGGIQRRHPDLCRHRDRSYL